MANDSVQYDSQELDDLLQKAGTVFLAGTQAYTDILEQAGRQVGAKAEELAGEYPQQPRRPLNPYYPRINAAGEAYISKFKTQKQQGYFFANVAEGNIRVPYKRSGFLGASITSDVEVTATGVVVEVGSPLGHAPLVIGDADEQSYYHAETGWQPLGDQLDEASDVLLNVFVDGVVSGVEAYLTR